MLAGDNRSSLQGPTFETCRALWACKPTSEGQLRTPWWLCMDTKPQRCALLPSLGRWNLQISSGQGSVLGHPQAANRVVWDGVDVCT